MKIIEARQGIRLVSIIDTRTWWQKSALSRISWRVTLAMSIYGAFVGGCIESLR